MPNFCPECGSKLGTRKVEGRSYQACMECAYTHWNNPIPVVAAIVELNGEVVLVHNKLWPPKMFGLVTGFLEEKEDPELAVRREVKEELGLEVISSSLVGVYGFDQQNQVIIAYHVSCEGRVELGDELDAYKAISPLKLKPWDIGTGPAVKDWLASQTQL